VLAKDLTIPQRLEYLLKKRGVSQNALARVAGVSPQTVANTLRHGRVPQSKTTLKWAKTLGVPGTVFTSKKFSDLELNNIISSSSSWKFAGSTGGTTRKATTSKSTTRKPAAKKAVAKKAVAKKTTAKKTTARKTAAKPAARKTVAKKAVARKPVAKKAVAKKAVAKKTVARKPIAKKAVAKKTVARKPIAAKRAVAKRTTSTGSASRSTGRKTVARKSTIKAAPRATARGGQGTFNGSLSGIDWNKMVTRLERLSNSRKEEVQLGAITTLLSLRK